MRMRPFLVAAVCSAGAAMVLVLGELATIGAIPHVGVSTNMSVPETKNPSQSSSSGSLTLGSVGAEELGSLASSNDTQADNQSTAQASPNSGGDQSTLAGFVQQTLSNAAPPITVGPIGH